MNLSLSNRDLTRLGEVTEALLSPARYSGTSDWCATVLGRIDALFETDRSALIVPRQESVHIYTENVPADAVQALEASVSEVGPHGYRSEHTDVNAVLRSRRATGMKIFQMADLARNAGFRIGSSPFYQEVLVPNGMAHSAGIAASLPLGEAWLCIGHSRPMERRFAVEDEQALLTLILPPFYAATQALFGTETEDNRSVVDRHGLLPSAEILRARYGLTHRESEVALLLATGASDRQIAGRLTISPHTVRTHSERIFRKLNIHSRKALALWLLSDK